MLVKRIIGFQRSASLNLKVITIVIIFTAFFSGCSSFSLLPSHSRDGSQRVPLAGTGALEGKSSYTPHSKIKRDYRAKTLKDIFPWALWKFGKAVGDIPLPNARLAQADEYIKKGEFEKALSILRDLQKAPLSPLSKEALVLRLASLYLIGTGGSPEDALSLMSRYYQERNLGVSEVDFQFSLLFAYAYGANGDIEQSLAWFNQAENKGFPQEEKLALVKEGVKKLISLLPDYELSRLSLEWREKKTVSVLIAQERAKRMASKSPQHQRVSLRKFWLASDTDQTYTEGDSKYLNESHKIKVGVLLPFSGRFSQIALSAKRGIELALLGMNLQDKVQIVSADTYAEPVTAALEAQRLFFQEGVSVIFGPLISDCAAETISRLDKLPPEKALLTFSKRSFLRTGRGVYRLGPTVESQVASLLTAGRDLFSLTQYGVVFPSTTIGEYFADIFRSTAKNMGLQIVYETSYFPDDKNALLVVAEEIEQQKVRNIFLSGKLGDAVRLSTSIKPYIRKQSWLLGGAHWYLPSKIARSRTALDSTIFVAPFYVNSSRPIVKQFIRSYSAKFKTPPDFFAAQGFDGATILLAALQNSLTAGTTIQEGMSAISFYQGISGTVVSVSNGELKRFLPVVVLKDKKIVEGYFTRQNGSYKYLLKIPNLPEKATNGINSNTSPTKEHQNSGEESAH